MSLLNSLESLPKLKKLYDQYGPIVSQLADMTVSDDVVKFEALAKALNLQDDSIVKPLMDAIQKTAGSPDETLLEYVKNGGAMRLLAGVSNADYQSETSVIACPHCNEPIYM